MVERIDIVGATGIAMRAILVTRHEVSPNHKMLTVDRDLVEFYDRSHEHTPDGQFITAYHLETLNEGVPTNGLDLLSHVPEWKIDGETKNMVVTWANYHIRHYLMEILGHA